jgi:hypothetical protein
MCDILTRNKPGSHGHRHYTVDLGNMFSRQRQERPIDLALPSHTRTIHTKNHRPSSSVEGLVDEYDGVEWESKDDVILDEPSLMDLPAEIRGMIYDHLPKASHGKYYRASNMKELLCEIDSCYKSLLRVNTVIQFELLMRLSRQTIWTS